MYSCGSGSWNVNSKRENCKHGTSIVVASQFCHLQHGTRKIRTPNMWHSFSMPFWLFLFFLNHYTWICMLNWHFYPSSLQHVTVCKSIASPSSPRTKRRRPRPEWYAAAVLDRNQTPPPPHDYADGHGEDESLTKPSTQPAPAAPRTQPAKEGPPELQHMVVVSTVHGDGPTGVRWELSITSMQNQNNRAKQLLNLMHNAKSQFLRQFQF
jgi:hypothetical protein